MAHSSGRSDPGRVRSGNEDSFVADPSLSLFAVADGMGGHSGGEIASQLAVETLVSFIRTSRHDPGITWPYGFNTRLSFEGNQLQSGVQLAHQQIRYHAQRRPECSGMGSTLVAVLLDGIRAVFANVGDSRLYLWRRGVLRQLSEDDSWAASMLRAGASRESVERHEMRHVLTRALGSTPELDLSIGQVELEAGDVLLMCSDGLHGPLGDDGIARVLHAAGDDLDRVAEALIAAANDAGGPDNVTAVLVRHVPDERQRPKRRLADASGQSTTEYVATAGILVALGIVLSAMLTDAFRVFVRHIAHEVSFLSP